MFVTEGFDVKPMTADKSEIYEQLMKARKEMSPDDPIIKGADIDADYASMMLNEQASQYEQRLKQAGWVIIVMGVLCVVLSILLVLK